jgi:hypothetical protein
MAQSSNGRILIDADKLNMGDMRRARERLTGQFGGRDPVDLLNGHFDEQATLIVWCVHARTDESYTWEQAEAVPFGELQFPEEPPPPPTPEPAKRGSRPSGSDTTG